MSETGCAILTIGEDNTLLVIISKAGYEDLFGKFMGGLKAEQDAKEKTAEQQKAKEKALKDSL